MKKIICAILCVVMMVCSLTGCLAEFDAKAYVQGNIDVVYLNKITDEYLKIVSNTKDELNDIYEQGMEVEADYFVSYFSIDLSIAPEGTFERIVEIYKQIYANSKYEVGEPLKSGEDYLVDVTIYPMDIIMKVVEEDWEAFEESYVAAASESETELTAEELEALWVDGILGLVENRISNIGYLEPQTISISVTKGADGAYSISDNDFGRIDTLIIQY